MLKTIALGAGALSLAACASTPYAPTLYDPDMAAVESITLVRDPLPEQVIAAEGATDGANMASVAGSAVPIAGIFIAAAAAGVAAKAADIRHDKINDALEVTNYDAEGSFIAALTRKLEEEGYAVTLDMSAEERDRREFLEDYKGLEVSDAYLDVFASGFGFQRASKRDDWRPRASVSVRLVSAENGETLLDHRLLYNPLSDVQGAISIDPDPQYAFASIDAFTEDPASLAAAIDHLTEVLTDEIVGLLK